MENVQQMILSNEHLRNIFNTDEKYSKFSDSKLPDALQFLELEVWLGLIVNIKIGLANGNSEIRASVLCNKKNIIENDLHYFEKVLKYNIIAHSKKLIAGIEKRFQHTDINSNLPLRINFEWCIDDKYLDLSSRITLQQGEEKSKYDLAVLYGKGIDFSQNISNLNNIRHYLIELLYVDTNIYSKIDENFKNDKKSLIIVGPPKSGKSYSSFYWLYKKRYEDEHKVFSYSNLREFYEGKRYLFSEIDRLREIGDKKAIVFLDDPFGHIDFKRQSNQSFFYDAIQSINSLISKENVFVLMTSRRGVYSAAQNELSLDCSWVGSCIFVQTVEIKKLLSVLGKIGWLRGASWAEELNSSISARDKNNYWLSAIPRNALPGMLTQSIDTHPNLRNIKVFTERDVLHFKEELENAQDVQVIFLSELANHLSYTGGEGIFEAYILLPAMTNLSVAERNCIFDGFTHTIDAATNYHEVYSDHHGNKGIRYTYDGFSQAVLAYMLSPSQNGEPTKAGISIIENKLFKFFNQQPHRIPNKVLRDVCATYICLGGSFKNCEDILTSGELSDFWDYAAPYLRVLEYAFSLSNNTREKLSNSIKCDIEAVASDLRQWSLLCSMVEQQLSYLLYGDKGIDTTDSHVDISEFDFAISRMSRIVDYVFERSLSNEGEISVEHMTIMLHAILAGIEKLSQSGLKYFRELVGIKHIMSLCKKKDRQSDQVLIIWVDAVLMKIGELNYYLRKVKNFRGAADKENLTPEEVYVCYSPLQESLVSVIEKRKKSRNSAICEFEYFRGGVAFTVWWHKCLSPEFQKWVEFSLSKIDSNSDNYWDGVVYNAQYHWNYNKNKKDAWSRQASIFLFLQGPRLGAQHHHETGLRPYEIDSSLMKLGDDFYAEFLGYIAKRIVQTDEESIYTAALGSIYLRAKYNERVREKFGRMKNKLAPGMGDIVEEIFEIGSWTPVSK